MASWHTTNPKEESDVDEPMEEATVTASGRKSRKAASRASIKMQKVLENDRKDCDVPGDDPMEGWESDGDDYQVEADLPSISFKKTKTGSFSCEKCKFVCATKGEIEKHCFAEHASEIDNEVDEADEAFEDDSEASDNDDEPEPSDEEYDVMEDKVEKSRSPKKWNPKLRFKGKSATAVDRNLLDGSMLKLENSFRIRNYHFNDFPSFRVLEPLKRIPIPLDCDQDEFSVNFKFGDKDQAQKLRRFQAISHEASKGSAYSIFAGGPISTSDWCPQKWNNSHDIIALSALISFEEAPPTSSSGALVQFWAFDCHRKSGPTLSALMKLENVAQIHGLKWCPSLKKETESDQRLGLLAVACSDGTVKIFTIGHDLLKPNTELEDMFVLEPSMTLKRQGINVQDGVINSIECLKISWYRGKNHRVLAGIFNDGYVALWDLCTKSPLLTSESVSEILPWHCLKVHTSSNKMALALSEDDGECFPKYLFTGSSDKKLCAWDLSRPLGPILEGEQSAHGVNAITWLSNHQKSTICAAYDDSGCANNNRVFAIEEDFNERGVGVTLHNSSVESLAFSPLLNIVGSGDASGNLVFYIGDEKRDPTQTMKHNKHPSLRRTFLYSSSMSADKDDLDYLKSLCDLKNKHEDLSVIFEDRFRNPFSLSDSDMARLKVRGGMSAQDLRKYPLLSINQINFSPNIHSKAWLFTGAQSGLGRLFHVPHLVK